jgi:hypothetical protein
MSCRGCHFVRYCQLQSCQCVSWATTLLGCIEFTPCDFRSAARPAEHFTIPHSQYQHGCQFSWVQRQPENSGVVNHCGV